MLNSIKKSFILSVPVILAVTGLIIFSFSFRHSESPVDQNSHTGEKIETKQFIPTMNFLAIEYEINQTLISNKEKLYSKILDLDDEFQRKYLTAILKKRTKDYSEAYSLLTSQLDQNILYYPYFEELADLANITGNIDELNNLLTTKLVGNINLNFLKGILFYKLGNYRDAISSFEKLLSKNKESKEIYFWLSYFYRGEGNYEKSFQLLDKADSLTDKKDIYHCKILLAKGSLYYFSDDYDNSEKFYKQGYEEAKSTQNNIEEARGLANLAIILDESGDVDGARNNLRTAIDKIIPIENLEMLAYLYSELGVSYTYTNDIIDARKNYEASLNWYSILNNRERLSYLSTNIGSIYLQLTNYSEALNYYKRAYDFAGENILGKILSLTGLADVYANMANYSKALEYYHKAEVLADSIHDISSKTKVEIGLGTLYFNINRPNSSLKYFNEAEKLLNPDEFPYDAADIYYRTGIVETYLGEYEKGESHFQKGLNISEKYEDIYNNIAIKTEYAYNLYKRKRYNESVQFLNDAKSESEKYGLTQLIGLQNLYLGKDFIAENKNDLAIEKLEKAFTIGEEVNDLNNQIEAAYTLAGLYKTIDKKDQAEKWYKKSIELIETAAAPLFNNQDVHIAHFSGFNNIYNSVVEFYLDNHNEEAALNMLERSRSRNTLQNIVNLKLSSSEEDKASLSRYLDLKWLLKSNLVRDDAIDSIKSELSVLESIFKKKNKQALSFQDPALPVDSIRSNLKNDELIISVYSSKDFTHIFNISKDSFSFEKINVNRDSLLTLIRDITPVFDSSSLTNEIYVNEDLFSFNAKSAFNLYNILFKNTLDKIGNDKKVIFSLPPEMLTVPLEFLVTSWDESQSPFYYSDKHFLIERFPISYTPSASIYIRQEEFKPTDLTQILLLGDPDITNTEFASNYRSGLLDEDSFNSRNVKLFPLEFSKSEIENIGKLLNNNLVLLSNKATETNLKKNASSSKIIHLSSHSFLYKDQPLILLSKEDDKVNDGYLEMGEIVNMNLKSDLVVLSSCRSGLGKIENGEGVIGMQKSFFDAGAGSIIVSLWDVNDKYTSFFMERFYQYLSEGLDKNEALRKAKLSFIKDYSPNPYFWSAFVLSGNISPVRLEKSSSNFIYYVLTILILLYLSYVFGQKVLKKNVKK